MPSYTQDLSIQVDGADTSLLSLEKPLVRAVVISLFTWRRAAPSDAAEGVRWGWWADGMDGQANDRIGSRLWLLVREKLTASTLIRAREYAQESLQWLIDDGVATRITCTAERRGLDGLALRAVVERDNAAPLDLRFEDVWSFLNV